MEHRSSFTKSQKDGEFTMGEVVVYHFVNPTWHETAAHSILHSSLFLSPLALIPSIFLLSRP